MKQIEELLKLGIEVRDSIKPVELTEENSFIYDFSDLNTFIEWKNKILKEVRMRIYPNYFKMLIAVNCCQSK